MNRTEILNKLASLRPDADGRFDAKRDYLRVLLHERILSRDVWLVVGARGMGKTTLHNTLTDSSCIALVGPIVSVKPQSVVGWSGTAKQIPPSDSSDAHGYWLGSLVRALDGVAKAFNIPASPLGGRSRPSQLSAMSVEEREGLLQWVFDLDHALSLTKSNIVVSYDALEKVAANWEPFVAALIALWVDLAPRLSSISPKIFLREDIRDRVQARGSDFAKINSRTVVLSWSPADLFRLLTFVVANVSEEAREWLVENGGFQFKVPEGARLSYWPPDGIPDEGPGSQDAIAQFLCGRIMGKGSNKGLSRRWIPKTLSDGRGAIAPRSALWLLRGAAEDALRSGGDGAAEGTLFTPDQLREGMRVAARNRASELQDERADVVERLERLRGKFVPLREADLAWQIFIGPGGTASLPGEEQPGYALTELERLGVIMQRSDGRYDVPDLYRLGFEIKRHGGTPVAQRT